ncbi:MAG: MtnX-like HAD-IB family phosphatase [Dehalococcoidales bacterium]|nr:MtnX-like HAD-IB family phosphatase [Dehalococcoidales bacterium]
MEQKQKIMIQCDFDGTVTEKDVSFMILDAFAKGNWRAILQQYSDGKITVGEFNRRAFDTVAASKETMLDYIKDRVKVRPGFKEFVKLCQKKDFSFVIVSNGLDFYIEKMLRDNDLEGTEYHAAETRFHPDGLKVRYVGPDGREISAEFKNKYSQHYLDKGYRVVYIGNGTSDFSAAKYCNQIFATDSLLEHCQNAGLDCIPFTTFTEVAKVLKSW